MILTVNKQSFAQDVLEASGPVLVHFWAPWCGICRLINPLLMKLSSQRQGELKLVGLNADENFHLANRYQIKTLPTVIVFEGGKVVERLEGFKGREDLEKSLSLIIDNRLSASVG